MQRTTAALTEIESKRKKDAEEMLTSKEVPFGPTQMAQKKAPGRNAQGGEIRLVTNLHSLDLTKKIELYRYEVKVDGVILKQTGEEIRVDLTERDTSDYRHVDRRCKCRDVMQHYEALNQAKLNATDNLLYYDLSRTLFTLKELTTIPKMGLTDRYKNNDLPVHNGANGFKPFPFYDITIRPVTDAKAQFTLGDFGFLTDDAGNMDRSLEQFLDIATAQNVFKKSQDFMHYSTALSFLLYPTNYGFDKSDSPYFSTNSSYLGIGTRKAIQMIEGGQQKSAAMVINVAKTPFHCVEELLQKVQNMMPTVTLHTIHNGTRNQLSKILKGLYVTTTYKTSTQNHQTFAIMELSDTNATTETIEQNGHTQTVEQYYKKKYNIKLEHPLIPLVIRQDRKDSKYPMELLVVCDNQRIKTAQQTPAQNTDMIKKCAVPPATKQAQINNVMRSLELEHSEHLERAGIKFHPEPVTVRGRVLQPPDIGYARGAVEKPRPGFGNWMGRAQYFIPAQCNKWFAFAFAEQKGPNMLRNEQWTDFVNRFHTTALQKGMQIPPPEQVELYNPAQTDLTKLIKHISEVGAEFVLIAHPDGADQIHHQMKYNERMTEVVTQGVKLGTVKTVLQKGQPLTVTNIVNKTNIKMGGLNYMLPIFADQVLYAIFKNTLFIGFSMNHPAGGFGMSGAGTAANGGNGNGGANGKQKHSPPKPSQSGSGTQQQQKHVPPSVVGYAANIGPKHHFEFMGDYKYQEARRDEKLDIIAQIVVRCVDQFRKREGKFPERIMTYRNACGEGYYQHLLKYEVPLVKHFLNERGCYSKLTLLVVNKLQGISLFPANLNPRDKAPGSKKIIQK